MVPFVIDRVYRLSMQRGVDINERKKSRRTGAALRAGSMKSSIRTGKHYLFCFTWPEIALRAVNSYAQILQEDYTPQHRWGWYEYSWKHKDIMEQKMGNLIDELAFPGLVAKT
jgi:hypothetical protein